MEFNSVLLGFAFLAFLAILVAYELIKERMDGRDDEWEE